MISGVLLYALQGALDDDAIDGAGSKKAGDHPPVSTLSVLRSPAVLLCFVFFFLITAAFGALQNFSAAALKAMYGLSLATSASCLSAYVLGGAAGIAAGGFMATKRAQEQIIAVCITFGACMSLLLASGVAADWAILPLMALMGAGVGVAGPSRDLLVRKAATNGANRVIYHCHATNVIALTYILPLTDRDFTRALWQSATECPVVFPEGVGVCPWMVPGGADIAMATSELMKKYQAAIWAQHGLFASGPDFDITFGLAHTIEKSAEIYVKVLSMGGGLIRQTITDDDLRAIAYDFGVQLNEEFLD